MFLRALASFLVLPGVVAGLVPPMIAAADPWRGAGWTVGIGVLAVGLFVLLWTVRDFYVAGKGTLAPWDPQNIWSSWDCIGTRGTPCTWA